MVYFLKFNGFSASRSFFDFSLRIEPNCSLYNLQELINGCFEPGESFTFTFKCCREEKYLRNGEKIFYEWGAMKKINFQSWELQTAKFEKFHKDFMRSLRDHVAFQKEVDVIRHERKKEQGMRNHLQAEMRKYDARSTTPNGIIDRAEIAKSALKEEKPDFMIGEYTQESRFVEKRKISGDCDGDKANKKPLISDDCRSIINRQRATDKTSDFVHETSVSANHVKISTHLINGVEFVRLSDIQSHQQSVEQQTVNPVENPAVPRQEQPAVFGTAKSFEFRFK